MTESLTDRQEQAAAEIAVHPERQALANLLNVITISVFVLTILAVVYVGWAMAT